MNTNTNDRDPSTGLPRHPEQLESATAQQAREAKVQDERDFRTAATTRVALISAQLKNSAEGTMNAAQVNWLQTELANLTSILRGTGGDVQSPVTFPGPHREGFVPPISPVEPIKPAKPR